MGKDIKLLPECQKPALSSLRSNILENRLGDMSFVLCALSYDSVPKPDVNTGVIMKKNNDMKRCISTDVAQPKDPSQQCYVPSIRQS